ncbi:MAG: APC family permease [Runella sp.]
MKSNLHKIGWKTAAALVVSNMIGTGVFTSLGYQLVEVQNAWSIVLLWLLGGVLALIGAFTFAELGTHYNKTGGDYVFISEGFHPFWGYLSAFTSLVVGFAAPVAIAVLAMEAYLSPFEIPYLRVYTVGILLIISALHSFSLRHSGIFQNVSTVFKLLFIAFLLGIGAYCAPVPDNALQTDTNVWDEITRPGFAVSLLYVTYAYTGWNAAAYIVGEIKQPKRNLPRALVLGTMFVMVVYVLLQWVFMKLGTYTQLQNQAEVAILATQNVLGTTATRWISAGIGLQLVATMSSYTWIGPRVIHTMAQHFRLWRWLRPTNAQGVPVRAIWLQCVLVLVLMLSGSLQRVLLYTSFLLQLMGTLAVASYLKIPRRGQGFKSPLGPYLQYGYIGFSVVVLGFILWDKPTESLIGLGILGVGAVSYFWGGREANLKV